MNKATVTLNDTLDWMDLTDSYRTFAPKAADYTFFSYTHITFSRIDQMLGHKTRFFLKKFIVIQL